MDAGARSALAERGGGGRLCHTVLVSSGGRTLAASTSQGHAYAAPPPLLSVTGQTVPLPDRRRSFFHLLSQMHADRLIMGFAHSQRSRARCTCGTFCADHTQTINRPAARFVATVVFGQLQTKRGFLKSCTPGVEMCLICDTLSAGMCIFCLSRGFCRCGLWAGFQGVLG